jgi:hypothetical protein
MTTPTLPHHSRGQVFDGVSDDMFNTVGGLPGPDIPPAAINSHRATNFETPVKFDISHSFYSVKLQINGALPPVSKTDGFVASRISALKAAEPHHTITQAEMAEPMAGFSPTTHTASGAGPFADARVICSLARDFGVCDNWHASIPSPPSPTAPFSMPPHRTASSPTDPQRAIPIRYRSGRTSTPPPSSTA